MLMEEERILFYIALTRAKNELFLLTRKGNESSFLDEILEEYSINFKHTIKNATDTVLLCEKCKNQLQTHFFYCPNYGNKIE